MHLRVLGSLLDGTLKGSQRPEGRPLLLQSTFPGPKYERNGQDLHIHAGGFMNHAAEFVMTTVLACGWNVEGACLGSALWTADFAALSGVLR